MDYIRLVSGIVIFSATCIFVFLKIKNDFKKLIRYMLFGSLTSLLVVIVGSKINTYTILRIIYTYKASTLTAPYEDIFSNVPDIFGYKFFIYFLCIIIPVFSFGFLASFFESTIMRLTFFLRRGFNDVYVFSELNEKSLQYATQLSSLNLKCMILFCNTDMTEKSHLASKAKRKGFLIFNDSEIDFFFKSKNRVVFVESSTENSRNLHNTIRILEKYTNNGCIKKFDNYKIIMFSDSDTNDEVILNSINKKGFEVIIINDYIMPAYQMIFNNSIIKNSVGKNVTVLVVGCGKTGSEILKALVWCGELGDFFKVTIKVIDAKADSIRKRILHDCPELFENMKVNFIQADVFSSDIENVLRMNCNDVNYITVCVGTDDENIKAALYLRSYYLAADSNFSLEPVISLRVKDQVKSEKIRNLCAINREKIDKKGWMFTPEKMQNYNLNPFGDLGNSLFNYFILSDELDKLALNVHSVYEHIFNPEASVEMIKESFCLSETNRRSDRAVAIHAKYKLNLLGFDLMKISQEVSQADMERSVLLTKSLIEKISDPAVQDVFGKLEHDRWNAFQRAEGWKHASLKNAESYMNKTGGDHRFYRSKLHPCICTWNELDDVAEFFDMHLKEYDVEFLKKIPGIFGLIEDDMINISKVRYLLKEF